MGALARFLANTVAAKAVIAAALLVTAAALWSVQSLTSEDDILAFLPRQSAEVDAFFRINERFGNTDVALVGIRTDNVFSAEFLLKLATLTKSLGENPQLDNILSLANVNDFSANPELGGIVTAPLVHPLPESPEDEAALRAKVLSRDTVVGNLVAASGEAVLIYCYLGFGADTKEMAQFIHGAALHHFAAEQLFWGGAPFIASYVFDTTKDDLRRLVPIALAVIVLMTLVAFGDPIGTLIALGSTAMGVVWALGLMAFLGVHFNLVLSSMPVILCTVGTAYGVHILARFRTLRRAHDAAEALVQTLKSTGGNVLAAGLTTAASMASFWLMDIGPMRDFGTFTALGVAFTLVLSLTFLPALLMVIPLRPMPEYVSGLGRWIGAALAFVVGRRAVALGATVCVMGLGLWFVAQVDSRVDQRAFFNEGSPPARASEFFSEHFGGEQFVQIYVHGDFTNPLSLRRVQWLADRIQALPAVHSVQHVGVALQQFNYAMASQFRLPESSAQAGLLYTFLDAEPFSKQLITKDHEHALIHVKLNTQNLDDTEAALLAVENSVEAVEQAQGQSQGDPWSSWRQAYVLARLQTLTGTELKDSVISPLEPSESSRAAYTALVEERLMHFLNSEECAVDLSIFAADRVLQLAQALANVGADFDEDSLMQAISPLMFKVDPLLVEDLLLSVQAPLEEAWRHSWATVRAAQLLGDLGQWQAVRERLVGALWDMDELTHENLTQAAADVLPLKFTVNGLPVMHRGLSQSVLSNQWRSMTFSLLVVVCILMLLFRSVLWGLIAVAPTVCTLVVIYGGMGFLGIRLDIGTSMLASMITGIGVDYGLHLVAALRASKGQTLHDVALEAGNSVGPAIWISAIIIASGFAVLTLGDARPLRNVGGLTAVAMIVAAVSACVMVPALLRRKAVLANVTVREVQEREA